MILGVCQEHGDKCSLEFCSITQADFIVDCLNAKQVHFTSEVSGLPLYMNFQFITILSQATIVMACLLTDDAKAYAARPFVILGTCKCEDVESQKTLLQITSNALHVSQKGFGHHLYCIASDGDARHCRALALLTLTQLVLPSLPIFETLSGLRLFNMLCGDDDLTSDFNWKHILKHFHNTLLCLKGILIDGIVVTAAILKMHLTKNGMTKSAADAILSLNDKQDVTLMIQLLN